MPFKSRAQERLLQARHPEIAKEWAAKYGTPKNLPEHIRPQGRKVSHIDKVGASHLAR